MTLQLGKTPARNMVSFRFANYLDTSLLPKLPKHFGHEDLVTVPWQMLGNDQFGDCVWAGAAHETMLWNREAAVNVVFDDHAVLSDYAAVTGFNPNMPNTDQGTDMRDAASYRRKVGIVDVTGRRHLVGAYMALDPGNVQQLYHAMHLFGAVGMGFEFPASAMTQFNQNRPWSVVRGSQIEGGHYVPLVAKRNHIECVTWGRIQPMTVGFFQTYNDESIVYVSLEALTNGHSLEGFDANQLMADLRAL